jgi:hypothetical protein
MTKVCWFNDILSFAQAWKSIPHSNLDKVFYDGNKKKTVNIYKKSAEGNEFRINALSLFLHNVKPEWEDEVNKQGGEFRLNFQSAMSIDTLQKIWTRIVFDIVMKKFPEIDMVAGVRVLDKYDLNRGNNFRLEIWTKFAERNEHFGSLLEEYLKTKVIAEIIVAADKEDGKTTSEPRIEFK